MPRKGKAKEQGKATYEGAVKFSIFLSACAGNQNSNIQADVFFYFAEFTAEQSPPGLFALSQTERNAAALEGISAKWISMALTYLFRKATKKVKHFNKEKLIDKIAMEQDEILFSRNRMLDTMNFAEMEDLGIRDLPVMGIKTNIPVLDMHSPMAYCIAQHIHWNVTQHRGIKTCNRKSLQHCMIVQGMSLYKELAHDCLWCSRKRKRKRLLEVGMGPVSSVSYRSSILVLQG